VIALLTGAHGFIGSWIAERLLNEGARVVVLRRHGSGESRFGAQALAGRCDVVDASLLDLSSLVRAVNEYEIDVVFHLGARTTVGAANADPLATWEVNVRGTYNLLEACRVGGGGRDVKVVVASSYHAYGAHDGDPYREDFALRATRPYEASKACADLLARCYARTWDMPVAVTRLANVYGGGDLDFSRLLPGAARSIVKGERPVIRSDGTPEGPRLERGKRDIRPDRGGRARARRGVPQRARARDPGSAPVRRHRPPVPRLDGGPERARLAAAMGSPQRSPRDLRLVRTPSRLIRGTAEAAV
jgi:nucleoside-diphosphate-sugar epimerase